MVQNNFKSKNIFEDNIELNPFNMFGNLYNLSNNLKLPVDFDAWKLFSNDKTEAIYISLACKEIIKAHINPADVLFCVLRGEGNITYNSQAFNLYQGNCIYVERGVMREWQNLHDTMNLELLVIKYL